MSFVEERVAGLLAGSEGLLVEVWVLEYVGPGLSRWKPSVCVRGFSKLISSSKSCL